MRRAFCRFFKQLAISVKVNHVLHKSHQAIEDGFCVVIGLQTTGESSMEKALEADGTQAKGFVSTTKEMITRFISGIEVKDAEGQVNPVAAATRCPEMAPKGPIGGSPNCHA